jgi:hypothetical protein
MEAILALGYFRQSQYECALARELAQKVLALAEAANAQATIAGGHSLLGVILVNMGEPQAAREHLEFAVAPLSAGPLQGFAQVSYVRGAAVAIPIALLVLGYPDTALRRTRDFLKARLSDPVCGAPFGQERPNRRWWVTSPAEAIADRAGPFLIASANVFPDFLTARGRILRSVVSAAYFGAVAVEPPSIR